MAEEGSVEERLLLTCQSGDTHTVWRLMLDIGMETEGGVANSDACYYWYW